jgi:glutathione S-transferase
MTDRYRLITIPASHYCEKARWALDRAGLAYDEDGHVPGLHLRATLPVRFHFDRDDIRTTPLLVRGEEVWPDSTLILLHVDEGLPAERRLFPADPALRQEVAAWEVRLDDDLGVHARRLAYWHLLPFKDLGLRELGRGVAAWEQRAAHIGFPLLASVIRSQLNVTEAAAARSLVQVRRVFADVDTLLGDGRPWLLGDRFTAADVALAALATPVVLPAGHPWLQLRIDEVPPAMAEMARELRATKAGQLVQRAYGEQRRPT